MSFIGLAIAIVDDEEPVRKALSRLLRAFGFDVQTFGSGEDFLGSLGSRRPDCTILDLHLGARSGLEVQKQLSQQPNPVPCIVITGKDEPGAHEKVLAAGAKAYLRKPLDEKALLAAIASVVPEHTQPDFMGESTSESVRSGKAATSFHGGEI